MCVCVQVWAVSGSLLETVFTQWDSRGTLQCRSQVSSSHPVYIVRTTGADAHHQCESRCCACFRFPLTSSFHPLLFRCRGGILRPPRRDPGGAPRNAPRRRAAARLELRCVPAEHLDANVKAFHSFMLIEPSREPSKHAVVGYFILKTALWWV